MRTGCVQLRRDDFWFSWYLHPKKIGSTSTSAANGWRGSRTKPSVCCDSKIFLWNEKRILSVIFENKRRELFFFCMCEFESELKLAPTASHLMFFLSFFRWTRRTRWTTRLGMYCRMCVLFFTHPNRIRWLENPFQPMEISKGLVVMVRAHTVPRNRCVYTSDIFEIGAASAV